MQQRSILHIDLDSFFVSVERLKNSVLKDKPVIVAGTSDRGVVTSCSYEARTYGIRSGMSSKMARSLCPSGIFIRGDMDCYTRYSNLVTEIVREKADIFEKASIDEFYLDLTGFDRFFGCYQWASSIKSMIMREAGLPVSFGLSINKLVAKIATGEAKPYGDRNILAGSERDFIAPLSVRKIPMVGQQVCIQLSSMGVKKVKTLREIPIVLLEQAFGKVGIELWKKANAIDDRPVVPYSEKKSISTETTFIEDTTDVQQLKSILIGMVEKLAFKLRESDKLTSCIAVKIRYADFNNTSRQCALPYTAEDHKIIRVVLELFEKLYNRRLRVRLIGVRLSHLMPGNVQLDMFEDSIKLIRLNEAVDRMKHKYGPSCINRAAAVH